MKCPEVALNRKIGSLKKDKKKFLDHLKTNLIYLVQTNYIIINLLKILTSKVCDSYSTPEFIIYKVLRCF